MDADRAADAAAEATGTATSRGLTFGAVASRYERYRPTYPTALIDDVVALLPGRRLVEIGAGTGKATRLWAAHDLDITAVEPDAAMAAVLAAQCAGRHVRIEVASFESWQCDGVYDGLVAAQSWHWTDAATRQTKLEATLRGGGSGRGGVVGLFWNTFGHADADLATRLAEVYRAHGVEHEPSMSAVQRPEAPDEFWREELLAAPALTDVEIRTYEWRLRRDAQSFIAYANTTSAHLIMPARQRDALTVDLVEAVEEYAGGEVDLAMRTDLYLARRV